MARQGHDLDTVEHREEHGLPRRDGQDGRSPPELGDQVGSARNSWPSSTTSHPSAHRPSTWRIM
ncbi:hypothetical protein [Lentzea albida]|uniref:hypothetical protein n=1 Tax=Lentzea albida TaxID=65499 RepID=UPI000B7FC6E7|nr:hypothetical protein [Lentzea albida]